MEVDTRGVPLPLFHCKTNGMSKSVKKLACGCSRVHEQMIPCMRLFKTNGFAIILKKNTCGCRQARKQINSIGVTLHNQCNVIDYEQDCVWQASSKDKKMQPCHVSRPMQFQYSGVQLLAGCVGGIISCADLSRLINGDLV